MSVTAEKCPRTMDRPKQSDHRSLVLECATYEPDGIENLPIKLGLPDTQLHFRQESEGG